MSNAYRKRIVLLLVCLCLALAPLPAVAADAAKPEAQCPEPTFADVPYGPHARNRLDFWQAATDTPEPLIIYIHGGGFTAGDKTEIRHGKGARIRSALDHRVSMASINYRFLKSAPLPDILRDTARAVQFLRSKSGEWHIDKTRVACFGESAGAGSSLWLAFHDDMADPNNPDPVLRESTRLTAAGALATQASYDFAQWPEIVGIPYALWSVSSVVVAPMFYRLHPLTVNTKKARAMRNDLHMLGLLDAKDPPVYLRTMSPKTPPRDWDHMLHHPRHAIAIKEKCDQLGVPAVLVDCDTPKEQATDVIAFLFEKFGVPGAAN